jgi:hypothetical protein
MKVENIRASLTRSIGIFIKIKLTFIAKYAFIALSAL